MNNVSRRLISSACWSGLLHLVVCAAALTSGLFPLAASATTITNTASVHYTGPAGIVEQASNTTSLVRLPPPSPAQVTFYQYAVGVSGSVSLPFDGGEFGHDGSPGNGGFVPLPAATALDGSPISLAAPVAVRQTSVYHQNEPVFITLADANRNMDPGVRELITVTVTTSTGDTEVLRMQETGPDSAVFAVVIKGVDPTQMVTTYDGRLSVGINTTLTVNYQDIYYPTDIAAAQALVDPFGIVFDSRTGQPLAGASVTLIDTTTGLPAQVFGDVGSSTFPSTLITGGAAGSTALDSDGFIYLMPPGGFRFPLVNPGSYRLVVTAPAGYTAPSMVAPGSLPHAPDGNPYAIVAGSYGDVFVVLPGPALNIDVPVDPLNTELFLQKAVSKTEAAAGDFLQYRLTLLNTDPVALATAVSVTDRLPFGMRYQPGSLRLNGILLPDPVVAADSRTLTMAIGNLAPGATAQISYVVMLAAGVQVGQAVNTAQATANAGAMRSNTADVAVRIREPLFSGRFTIIGRVYEGDCSTPWEQLKGVANARLMLEDGTYVMTDKDGQYHIEAVRPGVHVVQLDVDTLPGGLEPVSCIDNTRFAGRNFSQFVDVKGGGLWRADFHTRARVADVGIRLQSHLDVQMVTPVLPAAPVAPVPSARAAKHYVVHAEFDSCRATLKPEGEADVERLIKELAGEDIKRIELVGNTDNQRLSSRCQKVYKDNYALSDDRARTVGEALAAGLFLRPEQISATGRGPDAPVASNLTADGMARNRRTEVQVFLDEASAVADSPVVAVQAASSPPQVMGMSHRIEVDGSAQVDHLKVMTMLPDGAGYKKGSARIDGKPVDDPVLSDYSMVAFTLGKETQAGWARTIEFNTYPLPVLVPVAAATVTPTQHTVRARFDSCSGNFVADDQTAIDKLVTLLRGKGRVERIELVGHTDNQRLSLRCQQRYRDNQVLSQVRAQAVGTALARGLGLAADQISASGRGAESPIADNNTAEGRASNRRTEVRVYMAESPAVTSNAPPVSVDCSAKPYPFKAMANFDTPNGQRSLTPLVETRLGCPNAGMGATAEDDSRRHGVKVTQRTVAKALPPEWQARQKERLAILDDVAASGANTDWLKDQKPGAGWLFPGDDHNPRTPAVRIIIKHAPNQTVVLKQANGEAVSGLNYDGMAVSADRSVAVSMWRGVPLVDGANVFVAEVQDANGATASTFTHTIMYGNAPVRAEFVPEESILIADGINRPVLAVRLLDRDGHPVRAGVSAPFEINAPYMAWQQLEQEQNRQLAGMDRFKPEYRVEGDRGMAYIELAPTTDSGAVLLNLSFQTGPNSSRRQELRAWLETTARDWVVVGFAEGTLGYNTLKDNIQPLKDAGVDAGAYHNGQMSLYAKGRVQGKWLLTMAYDSNKKDQRDRQQGLLSSIDPNAFYTLYGDGSGQRYDAASQDNLYLKIERGQFYALFGDYTTGLTQSLLSRYSRTLNGVKTENGEGPVTFIAFAADTPQNFARDEIQGDGTSGLYRLAQGSIVLNSERIRIETRDRLHSEKILESRNLSRHIDYDIDYSAGTLFFRQPINSRDTNFNPIFIVSEYETLGIADKTLNAGGRVALNLNQGRTVVGVTAVRDENSLGKSDLAGVDFKLKLRGDAELRVEAAHTAGEQGVLSPEGSAWLAELERHNGKFDLLLYARRQQSAFGLSQQSTGVSGQQKVGADGQWHLTEHWSLQGQLYDQQNLNSTATRDAVLGKVQYQTDKGGASLGAQSVLDQAAPGLLAGRDYRSDQATAAVNRYFFDRRLELNAQADVGVGGKNQSIDFPNRYVLGAGVAVTKNARLLVGQEFTDGDTLDSSTTRAGVQVEPWQGAHLSSTLNQSQIGEYGPRTFGQLGLTQSVLLDQHWGLDFSVDTSHTFNEATTPAVVINPAHPITPGGMLGSAGLTEDFNAYSGGATYRADLWSWNGRAETRDGETTRRYGMVSSFLRQAEAGVAFSTAARAFRTEQISGTDGLLASLDLSWAWRPLGVQWSLLDRLEFRYDDVVNGSGIVGSGLFGNTSLVTVGNASSRRIINNFSLNRVSREWSGADRRGNLFNRYERNQWSLYYGAKYALDTYDGVNYSGYTDLLGLEVRHDVSHWLDVGVQASSLNAWSAHTHAYSIGPMIGGSPVTNGWITLGYNFRGFTDSDFDAARYTAQGPYLQLRFKFDQNSFQNPLLSDRQAPVRESETRESVR